MTYLFKTTAGSLHRLVPILLLPLGSFGAGQAHHKTQTAVSSPMVHRLSVDEILSVWRDRYGDFVGKSKQLAIERYGPPDVTDGPELRWNGSAKTSGRPVWILASGTEESATVVFVRVFPKPSREYLRVDDILKKAELFDFSSGTFNNSTTAYFKAMTKNGANEFTFSVDRTYGLSFESVFFYEPTK